MGPKELFVVILTGIMAIAWIPIGINFWRSWRARGSPLSLAICALVGFQVFLDASTYAFLVGDPMTTTQVMSGISLLLLLNFLVCFRWQKKNFPDARNRPVKRDDPPPDFWKRPRRAPTGDIKKTA